MLQNMQVFGPRATLPTLPLAGSGPDTDPIQIRNITGLEPVKANVNTTPLGSVDGETYNGSSVGKRNIVITFGLNPDWVDQSIATLRQFLYAYLMPKQSVKLRFFSDILTTCDIDGYVESIEPNIFSKDPEIVVSIINPLPYFIGIEPVVVIGAVTDTAIPHEIDYEGTVDTGFILEVKPTVATPLYSGALIITTGPSDEQFFQVDVTIGPDSYYKMSTVQGSKYARQIATPSGVITNLLRTLNLTAAWPQLQPGVNEIDIIAAALPGQQWTLTYTPKFGGL